MTYFIKTSEQELDNLIDDFLGSVAGAYLDRILIGALNGQGFGCDFYRVFLKGDDWDTETESYYFPTPIDDKHALIETEAHVDDRVNDSEIGYIPLDMLYKKYEELIDRKEAKGYPASEIKELRELLSQVKEKWQIK